MRGALARVGDWDCSVQDPRCSLRPAVSPLGRYLIETLVTLLGVIALAVLVLVAARKMGVGKPMGPMTLVGKLPLDGRRAVYLVRVGKTVYVVGASEAGLSKLGELADGQLEDAQGEPAPTAFGEVLSRVLSRGRAANDEKRRGAAVEPAALPDQPPPEKESA